MRVLTIQGPCPTTTSPSVGIPKAFILQTHHSDTREFKYAQTAHFYAAINRVYPSLIRVEADEVTYNLHVILRFELELALMRDDLRVYSATLINAAEREIPDLWTSISEGRLSPLRQWLNRNVHAWSGMREAEAIVHADTGKGLNADDFIDYLKHKYEPIFGVTL